LASQSSFDSNPQALGALPDLLQCHFKSSQLFWARIGKDFPNFGCVFAKNRHDQFFAIAGERNDADTPILRTLDPAYQAPFLVFAYLPTVRALLALNHNEPSKAVELLQTASPYELGTVVFASSMRLGPLYPAYVRGEAYLAARQGREAAVEFQKILDHRGIVVSDPTGALAHLQIGRAYAMQGDTAKAKAAYQDFLTLWKDADPDIPVLKQAKAEYAKLQ
jgi:tetratricopeptide (TPR) repeat protein